jgi:hypothetical protein
VRSVVNNVPPTKAADFLRIYRYFSHAKACLLPLKFALILLSNNDLHFAGFHLLIQSPATDTMFVLSFSISILEYLSQASD